MGRRIIAEKKRDDAGAPKKSRKGLWFLLLIIAILVSIASLEIIQSLEKEDTSQAEILVDYVAMFSEIPDNGVLSKAEFFGVLAIAIEECSDSCSCGDADSKCRKKVFNKELTALGSRKEWSVDTYSKVRNWFARHSNSPQLIKVNERKIHGGDYYRDLTETIFGEM